MICRRLALALPLLAAPRLTPGAWGQAAAWTPTRPLRIIVAWPAGGSADASIRLVAPHMSQQLGQPVVIDNRGGASGSIGAGVAAQAAPDGYTYLFDAAGQVSNPLLMRGLAFDYERAFTPVLLFALLPNVLVVRADAPVQDVAGLVAYLRAHPGTPYASTGIGLMSHLAAVMFAQRHRLEVTHVPYRASAQSIPALLAGETFFTFNTTPLIMPLIRDGRLRPLAVATPRRIPALPDTPTMLELGYEGFQLNEWLGLFAPAGTPEAAIARVAEAARVGLADPTVRERHAALGAEIMGGTTADFAAFLAEQRRHVGALIRDNNIRLDS
ncbi:MAG: tripartite tricarboxylate transporter substrate binding protein [Rhodovarius sp.]|nr:tripartite tricarboxylate transporter substrate binding protein [Rhodovarius sp.]MCX7931146.1 tripartite tricarboxylate transporter substrate binding protein [Rhodovarius sp.]MDW8315510.1 tripartite tricarboxylate transporter substrate binding protein [Rhodovarius sp.]